MAQAALIQPLNTAGQRDPAGKYVLLSIGMSNTTQEFCAASGTTCASWTFAGQAAVDPAVNHATLAIANGARGGQVARSNPRSSLPALDADADAPRLLQDFCAARCWFLAEQRCS